MHKRTYITNILILGLLTAIGPFSIDMYLPGFTEIAKSLGTTTAKVSLSLSSFFIGIAAGQLIYGPLLDRFGRKKPLYAGLALYLVTTLICMEAKDIQTLIILRFIEAIGSCAAYVAAMALVRDLFGAEESAKAFSLLLLVLGASPMLAPTVGGYIATAWGWRTIFLVLAILAAVIFLLTVFLLPQGHQPDPDFSLKPGPIIRSFLSVLRVRQFIVYALVQSFAFAGLFAYVSGSPMVFMDIFQVSKKEYGWIFAFLSLAFIGFSQFNSLLLRRYRSQQIIRVAVPAQLIVSLVFFAGTLRGGYGLAGTIILIFLFLFCIGYTNPNAAALALAPFERNAGTASSVLGVMQMGIGALSSFAVSAFSNGSALPMIAVITATSVAAILVLFFGGIVRTPANAGPQFPGH